MHRNNMLRAALAALLILFTSACIEDIRHEVIERADDNNPGGDTNEDDDHLACAAMESLLAVDLAPSANTPASEYAPLTFIDWCMKNVVADDREEIIGNANAWQADAVDPQVIGTSPFGRATRPTLAQGARLDIHVLEPAGSLPFVQRIHFANREGPAGTCALEMRVYQQDIGASGKKPLLYFHGGGWRNRSTTLTAAEILTSHLVRDHVVFMPAYPLHDDKDGPAACRHATFTEILASAQQAFDWVLAHKDVFGATGSASVDVMGHSAGGQLAAYIATQNRARIGKLVNFYGPVEFADFIDEVDGRYADTFPQSHRLMASLLQVEDLAALERPYADVVMQNSLSEIITAGRAGDVPPFFMVQGNADETVPVEQALLACNALGGTATAAGGMFDCPNDSHVAIIDGAGHNLDRRCLYDDWSLTQSADAARLMDSICPTGNASQAEILAATAAAFEWLRE